MNYIKSRELAEKWNISQRRIVYLASKGKIPGAKLSGKNWVFPEHTEKPCDGRTRSAKIEQRKQDSFRYPLFEYKEESSFRPPLSAEEKAIKEFIEAFQAFRFQDAEVILENLSKRPLDRYARIVTLYFRCMLSIFQCDVGPFLVAYSALKLELSADFPHVVEMSEYLHEIDSVLGDDSHYSRDFHQKPAYCCHASFHPRFCNLSAIWLALGDQSIRPTDLSAHEAICALLDQTDNVFDSQAIHLYLACAYGLLNKSEERFYHFRKALALAEQYNMFYPFAVMQYYYSQKDLDDALTGFPEELRTNIQRCNDIFYTCHIKFTNALQMNSLYKHLHDGDYLYVILAVQGFANKEVAKRLNVSTGTVGKHYGEIYAQFGVKNKAELVELYHSLTQKNPAQ